MINKKGSAINELLIVLVLCLILSVILLCLILKRVKEEQFRTLKNDLDIFINSSTLYNIENDTNIISLKELVDEKIISQIKDPFNKSTTCDLYESRIERNDNEVISTLKCGDYLITKNEANKNIIYKVDDWNEKNNSNSNVKIGYNYIKNEKLVFDDYYEDYMFLYLFNKHNNTSYQSISNIPQNYNIINQVFYRKLTKIKEI